MPSQPKCYNGQSFGFTREGLLAIRSCIEAADNDGMHADVVATAMAEADRIEALLPPDTGLTEG